MQGSVLSAIFTMHRTELGRKANIRSSTHAQLSTTFKNNISPLCSQYDQRVSLTVERYLSNSMFSGQEIPRLPSRCIIQAAPSVTQYD